MSQDFIDDPQFISAKVALLKAQTMGQRHDNEMARSLAETAQLAVDKERQKRDWEQAASSYHRFYYFTGEITAAYSQNAIDTLSRWDRMDQGDPDRMYTIVICSPGGDVIAGFQLYSFLKGLSDRRPLRVSAAGLCASMATIIHQSASEGLRIIEPGCTYLLHKVSGGVGGRFDTISDTAEWMSQLNKTMAEIFASRGKMSAEEIDKRVDRRETYLTPEEVVNDWGLADAIEHIH